VPSVGKKKKFNGKKKIKEKRAAYLQFKKGKAAIKKKKKKASIPKKERQGEKRLQNAQKEKNMLRQRLRGGGEVFLDTVKRE